MHAIWPLFVSPDEADRGIGKALMRALVEHAQKLNALSIRLTTVHSLIPDPALVWIPQLVIPSLILYDELWDGIRNGIMRN